MASSLRVVLSCSLLLFAGCTKPTVFPQYMTVADVINNVKCELYMAIGETPSWSWLKEWTAGFAITLQVTRDTSGTGDVTLVVPYFHPGIGFFTIEGGGMLQKSGVARMSFNFNGEESLGIFMSKDRCAYSRQISARNNLAGETGLRLWFRNVIQGINQARIANQTTGFSYNLEFLITVEGHIRPSFDTTYSSGRIFRGFFTAGHRRQDANTLGVQFVPPKQKIELFRQQQINNLLILDAIRDIPRR